MIMYIRLSPASTKQRSRSHMEWKRMEILVGLVLVVAALLLGVRPIMAHLPPGICIDHCMRECKMSGIGVVSCLKYCPVHCLPPDSSTKEHYCNLGCMLDECARFTNDERRMTDCVFKCSRFHCNIDV